VLQHLPASLNTWSNDIASQIELVIERHLISIDEHIERYALLAVEIQVDVDNDVVVNKLDDLLRLLSDYRANYETRLGQFNRQEQINMIRVAVPGRGRPKICIDEEQVLHLRELNMSWKTIANILGVHEKTLRRNRHNFDTRIERFTTTTDEELDILIRNLIDNNSNAGERLIQGSLVGMGHRVQRWRLRASLKSVDPNHNDRFKNRRIRRRFYSVPYPNALWYVEGIIYGS